MYQLLVDTTAATTPSSISPRVKPPRSLLRRWRARVGRWLRGLRGEKDPCPNDGWRAAGGPVVVIAPHPDDEVIGCGGTVRRHVLAGEAVSIIYLTRGEASRGFPWFTPQQRQAKREAEARASSAILGAKDLLFLDGMDGHLSEPLVAGHVETRLAEALAARKPALIYIPHAHDNHRDHIAANQLVMKIAHRMPVKPRVLQYELWSPMEADFAVDVTAVHGAKLRAIRCHELALDAFNYVPTMVGLAAYRSGTLLQRQGYAEAFKRTALDGGSGGRG